VVLISWSFPGDVSVGIKCDARVLSEDEEDVDFDIIHNANDTFTVKYVPPAAGRYTIKVLFASQVCVGPGEGQRGFCLAICVHIPFWIVSNGEGILRTMLNRSLWFLKSKKLPHA
jgi:hypothetical protein